MKYLKQIIGFAAGVLTLACELPAVAQVGPISLTFGTNMVASATTNSTAGTAVDIGNQGSISFLITAYSTNASGTVGNQSNSIVRFNGSFDGTTYFQNGTNWDIILVPNSTNSVDTFYVLDFSKVKYFRQAVMQNSNTNLNLTISGSYFYK